MKVIHYSSSLSRSAGGLYFSVSGLTKALARRGLDVTVIGGADEHYRDDKQMWDGLSVIPHSLRWGRYGFDPGVLAALSHSKPDLFHVHGAWSAASLYGRYACALGIPVVLSPHGMMDSWIVDRKKRIKRVHAKLFETPVIRRGYVHALNRSEFDSVETFSPGSAQQMFILPNGIDRGSRADGVGIRSGAIYVGRLHPKKQVLELAEAWREGFPDAVLTIAGWGDAEYEASLRRIVSGSSNIEFVGPLYGAAKTKALRKARVFVLPSLSEGLPMAVLEALQGGAIPIITAECNLPELFDSKVAFRVGADFGDFQKIVKEVLARDETELVDIAKRGIEFSDRYCWDQIALGMIEQYDNILQHQSVA